MGENCLWIQHLLNELAIGRFELLAHFLILSFRNLEIGSGVMKDARISQFF